MGRLLDDYVRRNVTQLEDIVLGPAQPRGPAAPQPAGATTFPLPQEPMPIGQPLSGSPAPTFQEAPTQPLQAMPAPQVAPPPGQPAPVQGTFDAQPGQMPNIERGENSFMGMAEKAPKKDVDNALDVLEKTGVNIDEKYREVTGNPGQGMSRKEKGLVLLEFGLNLMAQSGTGEGTLAGDIGQAGLAALRGHQGRRAARAQAESEAEDRKLERRLKEAQIRRAEQPRIELKPDADGNLVRIDIDSGEAQPVTMDGEPVRGENQEMFATQVDRLAYEGEFCSGLSGDELRSCKQRALAYAKGVREVAFPQVLRADQTDRVMRHLDDPDNSSTKFPVNGEVKRWRHMTLDEQAEVAKKLVDRRIKVINAGSVTTPEAEKGKPTADNLVSRLSEADRARLKPGKIYTLSDGSKIRMRDGKPEIVE